MEFLANKRILITGMISSRSIAYGAAQAMRREGAEPAFTYHGECVRDRVPNPAEEFGELSRRGAHHAALQCDGHGQGQPGGQRALSGNATGTQGDTREWHSCRTDQDTGRGRHCPFGKLLSYNEKHAPLKRNVTIEEVGNAAAFPCSELAGGITGEISYVNGGFNTTAFGMTKA